MIVELRNSYIADVTFGHHNLGVHACSARSTTNIARSLRLLPPATVTRQDPHLWPVSSEGATRISETSGHSYVTPSQRGGEWSPYDECANEAEVEQLQSLVDSCKAYLPGSSERANAIITLVPAKWHKAVRSLLGSSAGGEAGGPKLRP